MVVTWGSGHDNKASISSLVINYLFFHNVCSLKYFKLTINTIIMHCVHLINL